MGEGDTPRSDNEEREQRILEAAQSLLLYYGYDKTTVSDIAREAGISKGAVYLHFSSKEALVDALINRDIRRYSERTFALLEADKTDWTFVSMYSKTLITLEEFPLVQAIIRSDRHVFGTLLRKSDFEFMTLKRQSRYPLLKAMQDAGALRADVDMKTVAYILDCFGYGMLNSSEFTDPDAAPSINSIVETWGDFMQRALVPEDGGNWQAGRQIILQMINAYRQQLNHQQPEQSSQDESER